MARRPAWWLYVLRCADGTLYTGISTDVAARLAAHHAGKGARYTRGRGPFVVIHRERCGAHGDALRRELEVKALPREAKLALATRSRRRPARPLRTRS
jgi:putative endonuclease